MTATATYMSDLNRVRVSWSGLSSDADVVKVERSTDTVTWVTVRGGTAVPVATGHLDDYEFVPGVVNTYRVTAVDTATVAHFGVGTAATGNNATLTPALPAGTIPVGAMLVLTVTHANTSASITTPTGWTLVSGGASHMAVFYRTYQAGVTAPSVAFTGGAAGDSCSAQIRAFTNAQAPAHVVLQTNASAQNVAYPNGTVNQDGLAWLIHVWKKNVFTGITGLQADFIDAQGVSNTAGTNTESHLTWRTDATANVHSITAGTLIWSGGAAAVSKTRLLYLAQRLNVGVDSTTITPTFSKIWLQNLARPYLNRSLSTPVGELTIKKAARAGVHAVVGRTLPIAVTDQRQSRQFTVGVQVASQAEADDLEAVLQGGDVLLMQIPPNAGIRLVSQYVSIGDTEYDDEARILWMPMTQVAAPGPSVVGTTVTWQDIVSTYATWADLLAAKATWAAVLDSVGSPTDIITG